MAHRLRTDHQFSRYLSPSFASSRTSLQALLFLLPISQHQIFLCIAILTIDAHNNHTFPPNSMTASMVSKPPTFLLTILPTFPISEYTRTTRLVRQWCRHVAGFMLISVLCLFIVASMERLSGTCVASGDAVPWQGSPLLCPGYHFFFTHHMASLS